ncbi:unnamed protein product, partial [marine sediment metagenome]
RPEFALLEVFPETRKVEGFVFNYKDQMIDRDEFLERVKRAGDYVIDKGFKVKVQ